VLGACAFAVVEILICRELETKLGSAALTVIALIFSSLVVVALSFANKIDLHIWIAVYAMLGFISGAAIFPEKPLINRKQKIAALILFAVSVCLVIFLHTLFGFGKSAHAYIRYTKYLLIPVSLFGSIFVAVYVERLIGRHSFKT